MLLDWHGEKGIWFDVGHATVRAGMEFDEAWISVPKREMIERIVEAQVAGLGAFREPRIAAREIIGQLITAFQSDASWETKYDFVLARVKTLNTWLSQIGLGVRWSDPDTSYEEDTRAVMEAVLRVSDELAKIERDD